MCKLLLNLNSFKRKPVQLPGREDKFRNIKIERISNICRCVKCDPKSTTHNFNYQLSGADSHGSNPYNRKYIDNLYYCSKCFYGCQDCINGKSVIEMIQKTFKKITEFEIPIVSQVISSNITKFDQQ